MKNTFSRYISIILLALIPACEAEQYEWISSSFSCGVLSTQVSTYSPAEMTLKTRFFVLDKEESDQLTKRDVEHNLHFSSIEVSAVMTDFQEITLPSAGKYSCAVLLDDVYNTINFDYFEKFSSTEIFLRKYFKNMGINNYARLAILGNQSPPVMFHGKYFTNNAGVMDLLLAELLGDPDEPSSEISQLPVLQGIDMVLDTINRSAPAGNRNLLLVYSRSSYLKTGITGESVIAKAKNYGIKVSTIMDFGGEYHIDYDLNNEDIFYKLAYETGGFVYKNNDALSGEDMYVLSSRLGNILEGNFKCFEATWKITPAGSWTDTFQPGYFATGEMVVELQTGYDQETFEMPLGIIIK